MHTTALVLFSGGQDSTTCLAQALSKYQRVETIAFDYRPAPQRRAAGAPERAVGTPRAIPAMGRSGWAKTTCSTWPCFGQVSETSLTRDTAFKMEASGLPNTFVPGRNLLFLTLAAALAYRRDLQVIVTGVCETDFSGYPDCRDDTMKAMQLALSPGHGPALFDRHPADVDRQGRHLADGARPGGALRRAGGGNKLVDLIVEHTHTCYLGRPATPPRLGLGLRHLPGV
jgi:7-cyano-7-deazaguanine synthase